MKVVYVRNNWKSHSCGILVMNTDQSGLTVPCALGRSGMTANKKEGDGATPVGKFQVLEVYYRADKVKRPVTQLPLTAITTKHGWCDAVMDRNYNKLIDLPYDGSHEKLIRQDHLYDIMVVLDYNIRRREQGRGSAIFFHLAHPDFRPTEGCVAVHEPVMRHFLRHANSQTVMKIIP